MKALGLFAGVGSLLYEAQQWGCDIVGNLETRSHFRGGAIYKLNFPDTPYLDEIPTRHLPAEWFECDLVLSHPPCGRHSQLGKVRRQYIGDAYGLLPDFTRLIRRLRPKVFALENLPKMLQLVSVDWLAREMPNYTLTFLILFNWDFGSCQKRPRLWLVGTRSDRMGGRRKSRRPVPFAFVPPRDRLPGPFSAWDAIRSLPWHPLEDRPDLGHIHRPAAWLPSPTYAFDVRPVANMIELAAGYLRIPPGMEWPYISKSGRPVCRVGRKRAQIDGPSYISSGNEDIFHPVTGWPLTPRERARILGWPDEFQIWEGGPITRKEYTKLINVTGKAVPSHLPRYLIPQLLDHARRTQ